jgi:serine phosphatase RsbU (regulator of sigma subunit)
MPDSGTIGFMESETNQSTDSALLLEKLRKESLEKSLLLEISKNINSSLNLDEVLHLILESLNQVIPFDAAGIFLVDSKTNRLIPESIRGYDHEALKLARLKVGKGLIGVVAREGRGIICPNVKEELDYIEARKETQSEMSVPLIVKQRLLGVLDLESDRLNAFDKHDFDLLTAFANHAAIAIDNARLHKEVLRSRELEHDLIIGREIQNALLPKSLPEVDGYNFAKANKPSKTVSGDLYDVVRLPSGKIGIAIGDISGKGTAAAILMASIYSSYKSLLNEPLSVAKTIDELNKSLCETDLEGSYATFFYGELQPESKRFTYCNAGHFPPVIIRRDGTVVKLHHGGTVLGFLEDAAYCEKDVALEQGDLVLFYTDGLVEARNPDGEFYQLEDAISLILNNPGLETADLKDRIIADVRRFTGTHQLEDDLTLVIMKVEGES